MAKAAGAGRTPGGGPTVTLTLTITLGRGRAEQLAVRAIREGKTLADVVREHLERRKPS